MNAVVWRKRSVLKYADGFLRLEKQYDIHRDGSAKVISFLITADAEFSRKNKVQAQR